MPGVAQQAGGRAGTGACFLLLSPRPLVELGYEADAVLQA